MTDLLNFGMGSLTRPGGSQVDFSPAECVILGTLWKHRQKHPGEWLNRKRQAFAMWGEEYRWPDGWENVLAIHHHHMRKKSAGCSFWLEHRYSFGDRISGDIRVEGDLTVEPSLKDVPA